MGGLVEAYRGVVPRIAGDVYLAATAAVIGDVEIGAEASLWYGVTVRGDVNDVRIGPRSNLQDGTVVHVSRFLQGTYIGAGVTVGHMALLHACTLEDDCFIGMKACVMDGAVVESGAMVAAGALVTGNKRVRTGEVWAGVPAAPWRAVRAEELADIKASADRYVALAAEYRAAQGDDAGG